MITTILKNYKTSRDYARLKQMLDDGEIVIVLWTHDTTGTLFCGLAQKYDRIYDLDSYLWTQDVKMSFEEKCRRIGANGLEFVEPNI